MRIVAFALATCALGISMSGQVFAQSSNRDFDDGRGGPPPFFTQREAPNRGFDQPGPRGPDRGFDNRNFGGPPRGAPDERFRGNDQRAFREGPDERFRGNDQRGFREGQDERFRGNDQRAFREGPDERFRGNDRQGFRGAPDERFRGNDQRAFREGPDERVRRDDRQGFREAPDERFRGDDRRGFRDSPNERLRRDDRIGEQGPASRRPPEPRERFERRGPVVTERGRPNNGRGFEDNRRVEVNRGPGGAPPANWPPAPGQRNVTTAGGPRPASQGTITIPMDEYRALQEQANELRRMTDRRDFRDDPRSNQRSGPTTTFR